MPGSWLEPLLHRGAGAPVLLEHRVSPGARLLTLAGHYGVTSERSELANGAIDVLETV